jgi:hypothetical protein
MMPESVFPLRIGAMPKQEPSVGTKAVVRAVGEELQPVPVKMLRGTASRRLEMEGAAWMAEARVKRVRRVNCMLMEGKLLGGFLRLFVWK